MVSRYLGVYSDLKYEYFIRETGVVDLTNAPASELRYYALMFKYWLEQEKKKNNGLPVTEANGDEMIVTVIS
jgi:hypothetical protein